MTRREAREAAFALLFENTFSDEGMEAVLRDAEEAQTLPEDEFALSLATGAAEKQEELDQKIAAASDRWKMDRISRVALTVMRLALYEVLYCDEIPVNVSLNEAVELTKIYGGEEEAAFVNGVLGGIVRTLS